VRKSTSLVALPLRSLLYRFVKIPGLQLLRPWSATTSPEPATGGLRLITSSALTGQAMGQPGQREGVAIVDPAVPRIEQLEMHSVVRHPNTGKRGPEGFRTEIE
jgi:hypothetical protein